jgi:hypothetical protein
MEQYRNTKAPLTGTVSNGRSKGTKILRLPNFTSVRAHYPGVPSLKSLKAILARVAESEVIKRLICPGYGCLRGLQPCFTPPLPSSH